MCLVAATKTICYSIAVPFDLLVRYDWTPLSAVATVTKGGRGKDKKYSVLCFAAHVAESLIRLFRAMIYFAFSSPNVDGTVEGKAGAEPRFNYCTGRPEDFGSHNVNM